MFNADNVLAALHEVVDEAGPDFQYTPKWYNGAEGEYDWLEPGDGNCYYVPDEHNPMGCIANAVLERLGLDTSNLVEDQSIIQQEVARSNIDMDGLVALQWAQHAQDEGRTWGQALAEAHASLRRVK